MLTLAAVFALKVFVCDLFFDAILLAFAGVGTWEMTRAFKEKLHPSQTIIVMVFAILVVLAYAVSDFIFQDVLEVRLPESGILDENGKINSDAIAALTGRNYALHITFVVFIAGVAVLLALLVFAHESVTLESTGYSLLCYVYPSLLLVVISVCNHLQSYSELALLFVFVVAPITDAFAFFFGKLLGKKFPLKMVPKVSPKKTVIGGVGGLIGGAIGAVIVFFMYYGIMQLDGIGVTAQVIRDIPIEPHEEAEVEGIDGDIAQVIRDIPIDALNLCFFMGLGVVAALFSQFGDLVESAIKRKVGIKDMGKILPGHGGILDRIDSALYAGLIVCAVMVLRLMIVG